MSEITITKAYRYEGELLLQETGGKVFAVPEKFNGWAERQFRPRSILQERPWLVNRLPLSAVSPQIRAPLRGCPPPKPLADNLTARAINKKRRAAGQPPLHDDYATEGAA